MKFSSMVFLVAVIALFACANPQSSQTLEGKTFTSSQYGFSFSYPSGWNEISRDLPQRWAITDRRNNTIIFIVSRAQTKNLADIGRSQALSDIYPGAPASDIDERELKEVYDIVKMQQFNGREWFTYGVKFSNLGVDSLVSGTLCGEDEVLFVLVTDFYSLETSKADYNTILNSFSC